MSGVVRRWTVSGTAGQFRRYGQRAEPLLEPRDPTLKGDARADTEAVGAATLGAILPGEQSEVERTAAEHLEPLDIAAAQHEAGRTRGVGAAERGAVDSRLDLLEQVHGFARRSPRLVRARRS